MKMRYGVIGDDDDDDDNNFDDDAEEAAVHVLALVFVFSLCLFDTNYSS